MKPLTIPGAPGHGTIVLIGGGEFSFGETREIDDFAVARMPQDNRRIAFLPAASGSTEYGAQLATYFGGFGSGLEVTNVPIYRTRDARRERNLSMLRDAGMIYIGGGVANALLDAVNGGPVLDAFMEALQRGAVLAAIGAGASCLGAFVLNMRLAGATLPGMNLIRDTVIDTGASGAADARLRRLMAEPDVTLGLALPRSTALAIHADRSAQIVGEGNVAVVRKASGQQSAVSSQGPEPDSAP